jgi:hypothetical protein
MIRRHIMPIHDRNLKTGTKLIGKYHKQSYKCEVVEVEGRLRFRLEDGREFKSTSAAGMAITGHACDGWVFWSVETASDTSVQETSQPEPTDQIVSAPLPETGNTAEPVTTPEQTAPIFFKMEWQRAVPKGQTRWHCNICNKHFLAPTGETPQTCPQGHKAS